MTPVAYVGGATGVVEGGGPNPTDAFSIGVKAAESNVAVADAGVFALTFIQADSNATPTDPTTLRIGTYADTTGTPTDAHSSVASLWGTGSAGAGVATPANADGVNNATTAVVSTAPAGSATETLTSNCGNAAAAGTFYASIVFKGWYKLNTVLSTSTAKVVIHSSTAAFTDIVIESIAAVNTTNDHLTTPFTSPELIGTIDTLAKLQTAQIVYSTTDAIAGTSPAIVTVDAGSLQLSGVL